jgi:hypothetical protein
MDIDHIVRILIMVHYERFYIEHNLSLQHSDVHMSMELSMKDLSIKINLLDNLHKSDQDNQNLYYIYIDHIHIHLDYYKLSNRNYFNNYKSRKKKKVFVSLHYSQGNYRFLLYMNNHLLSNFLDIYIVYHNHIYHDQVLSTYIKSCFF